MKIRILSAALSLIACGVSPASPVPEFPFIQADGLAKREVPPTNAEITFKVLAFAKSPEESTATVQAALGKVIAALKEKGVGEDQITANDLAKSAVRNRHGDLQKDAEVLGYEVSREVKIKLKDLKSYPELVRILMSADHISSVESAFDTDKRDEIESELVGEACAKARKQADLLAKGAGVTIASVHAVNSHGFDDLHRSFGFSYPASHFGGADNSEIPLFAPTSIELTTSVSILYRLNR
jgi:uncharacterized protein YggE